MAAKCAIDDYLEHNVLIMDGGLGVELERRGVDVKSPLWSTAPFLRGDRVALDTIKGLYREFRAAGSRGLSTLTYQASFHSMLKYSGSVCNRAEYEGFLDQVVEFTHKECVDPARDYIIGSVGPYAAFLCNGAEYTGDYGFETINFFNYFEPQVSKFAADPRIDAIAFETVPNVVELMALLQPEFHALLKSKPFYISISPKNEHELRDGTPLAVVGQLIRERMDDLPPNLLCFGINCVDLTRSPKMLAELNMQLQDCPIKFQAIYPNGANVFDESLSAWRPSEDADTLTWAEAVKLYLKQECRMIGGCCSTTPQDVRQIAEALGSQT
ncbi:AaceriAFR410Wp [[Ashbya] aceris (nom. inval.)]|nr:AaceriAFR410Wp [[Ashbya] aceris (nom. inval.)]